MCTTIFISITEEVGMEEKQKESAAVENPKKPIIIRDRGQPLELWPTEIHGVIVYTPTEEKSRELDERFRRKVVPREMKSAQKQ